MKPFVVKLSLSEPNLCSFVIRDGLLSTRSSTENFSASGVGNFYGVD